MRQVGPKAIVFAYPFYGVSAGTQIVAGGLRMALWTFYLALGIVSLPWTTMQAIIGIAAFQAIVAGYSPWVLGSGLVLLVVSLGVRRRFLRASESPDSSAR